MNWEQFRAILWLRWRLTCNQLTRGSGVGAVIATLAGVLLVMVALGAGLGAILVGALAMKRASATAMMFVWDGVVFAVIFFSLIAVLTELQRSESVDLTRLLHLPIGLKQVFAFNYLASLFSLGSVLGMAIMLGLASGLMISHGFLFVLALPLVVAFLFMLTAWIYCLRGWLLSLTVNPRRRRAIIMWITLGIILVSQTPQLLNLAWQRKVRAEREARQAARKQSGKTHSANSATITGKDTQPDARQLTTVVTITTQVHPWVPLLWLPNGVRGLAGGSVLPSLWCTVGMFALGWLGLSRAYRATLRFYRADEPGRPSPVSAPPTESARPVSNWIEKSLPWLPEDTAALALAQLRSLTRAPEVRMMLAMGLFMAIFLPIMIFWRGGSATPMPEAAKPFMGTGAVVMVLFALLQLVCNQFGCDRDGFRGLVLLATPRHRLLLGKNVALLPLASAIALVPLAAVSVFAKLPALVVAATVMQFGAAFLLFCTIGNLSSILAPFRIAAGSLKPTKQSWQTTLGVLAVHFLFPLFIAPVFLPPLLGWVAERLGGLPAAPVNLLATLLLLGLFAMLYGFTLRPLGRLLQRRETNILRLVTEIRE